MIRFIAEHKDHQVPGPDGEGGLRWGVEPMCAVLSEHGVPITSLGETRGDSLEISGVFDVPLEELRSAWTLTLPAAMV